MVSRNDVVRRIKNHLPTYLDVIDDARDQTAKIVDSKKIAMDMLHYLFGHNRDNIKLPYSMNSLGREPPFTTQPDILVMVTEFAQHLDIKPTDQAAQYCAREGLWAILYTNCIEWKVYNIKYPERPRNATTELYGRVDFTALDMENKDVERALSLVSSGSLDEKRAYVVPSELMNRFAIPQFWND